MGVVRRSASNCGMKVCGDVWVDASREQKLHRGKQAVAGGTFVLIHGRATRDEVKRVLGAEDERVVIPEARRALEKHQRAVPGPSPHLAACGLRVGLESEVKCGIALAKLARRHR